MPKLGSGRWRRSGIGLALAVALAGGPIATAAANPVDPSPTPSVDPMAVAAPCSTRVGAVSFSDDLDKLVYDDVQVGGLSGLAWDSRSRSYLSVVDNRGSEPSRLWSLGDNLTQPMPTGDPLVLRSAAGKPYTGRTADNEGLTVLPDGRYAVSSETEPSIRIFGRDGVQQDELQVPRRFRVAPDGQGTKNAALEGLTVSPDGKTLVAAMEATLSGDTGDGNYRRLAVYTASHTDHPGRRTDYRLTKQIGYRVDDGMRISDIAAYGTGKLLILEAAYDETVGNTIKLQTTDISHAEDVSSWPDLAYTPWAIVHKRLAADITRCPDLGATSKELQSNPLMDNFEAMTVRPGRHHSYSIDLLSDDNFSQNQTTRILNLVADLP